MILDYANIYFIFGLILYLQLSAYILNPILYTIYLEIFTFNIGLLFNKSKTFQGASICTSLWTYQMFITLKSNTSKISVVFLTYIFFMEQKLVKIQLNINSHFYDHLLMKLNWNNVNIFFNYVLNSCTIMHCHPLGSKE